jgi:hypothetical protein
MTLPQSEVGEIRLKVCARCIFDAGEGVPGEGVTFDVVTRGCDICGDCVAPPREPRPSASSAGACENCVGVYLLESDDGSAGRLCAQCDEGRALIAQLPEQGQAKSNCPGCEGEHWLSIRG